MNRKMKARLGWVRHYQQFNDAGLTCRRFGISRPTLRKWHKRFENQGIAGLADKSRRPKVYRNGCQGISLPDDQWSINRQ